MAKVRREGRGCGNITVESSQPHTDVITGPVGHTRRGLLAASKVFLGRYDESRFAWQKSRRGEWGGEGWESPYSAISSPSASSTRPSTPTSLAEDKEAKWARGGSESRRQDTELIDYLVKYLPFGTPWPEVSRARV